VAENFKAAIASAKAAIEKDAGVPVASHETIVAKCKVWRTSDFESMKVIGAGAFGVVHLVKRRGTEEVYALKQMKKAAFKRKNHRDRAFAEREILSEACSRLFVKLYATFQDDSHLYMVMEFLQGGDLINLLLQHGRFTHEQTRFYMGELLEALDTVHRCGFVHRDVKPDNIVLTAAGHVKLLDFGLCKQDPMLADDDFQAGPEGQTTRGLLKSSVGTPQYMAPEVFRGEYGKEADIWSLGVVTFECLVGRVPFHGGSKKGPDAVRAIRKKVVEQHADLLEEELQQAWRRGDVARNSGEFISHVLCEKDKRLDAASCRSSDFFKSVDFANLHLRRPPFKPEVSGPDDTQNFGNFVMGKDGCELPCGSKRHGVDTDLKLEWAHYDFDCKAHVTK